jgi:hypothetical protein
MCRTESKCCYFSFVKVVFLTVCSILVESHVIWEILLVVTYAILVVLNASSFH